MTRAVLAYLLLVLAPAAALALLALRVADKDLEENEHALERWCRAGAARRLSRCAQLRLVAGRRVAADAWGGIADGVARLARDLADRSWHRRYESLLTLRQLDVGYRLVVAELT